jgi:hypothetical protein
LKMAEEQPKNDEDKDDLDSFWDERELHFCCMDPEDMPPMEDPKTRRRPGAEPGPGAIASSTRFRMVRKRGSGKTRTMRKRVKNEDRASKVGIIEHVDDIKDWGKEHPNWPWPEDDRVVNMSGMPRRVVLKDGTSLILQPGESVIVDNPEDHRP